MKRITVLLACLALVAAGCSRSDSDTNADDSGTSSTSAPPPNEGTASFGDLTEVCQDGTPSGSPATGVTADSIRIATFSDVGFAGRPGLNQEFFDAADVFSEWCNDNGGINGREIVVDKRDAALTNVVPRMAESCKEDFAMVGGGAVFDQDGVEPRLKCLLPDFSGFVGSEKARGADLIVQPEPNAVDALQIGYLRYLDKKYPGATDHIGVLTGDLPLTKEVAAQNADAARSFEWKVVYDDVYSAAGAATWAPYAQGLKDKGVKGLIWIGEPENLAKLLTSLRDINYKLDFVRADANHYDANLITTGADALADTPVYVQVAIAPFEGAKPSSATGEYLDLFEQYKPGGKSNTYLGVNAFSAWLLFAKAASSCGNELTRTCLYDAGNTIDSWTGGGLHAETNPAANESSDCFGAVKATPDGFEAVTDHAPNEGIYSCSPKNIFELETDDESFTTLADVGEDIKNMK